MTQNEGIGPARDGIRSGDRKIKGARRLERHGHDLTKVIRVVGGHQRDFVTQSREQHTDLWVQMDDGVDIRAPAIGFGMQSPLTGRMRMTIL